MWHLLRDPFVHVNFDVGFYSDLGAASIEMVVRNSAGLTISATCFWREFITNLLVADTWACFQVARFTHEMGFRSVELKGDSLGVVI
ncbi:hypothetical protein PVK06_010764 [Gossypium arboreum]|uniref:RNase H type-1 domain-containing protein n=1 Tax=Gossypium arboreum TaxID=29729 RepID=A0ABR0Q7C2_GOSAR|nr:hypothetical protein PVK06_010764 [Gossypium arboreum]